MGNTLPATYLTPKEVAVIIGGGIHPKTVARMIRAGEIKAKRVGDRWRVAPEWLSEYMQNTITPA